MHSYTNHFTNFKNFAVAQIDLFKPLTILIGKNGSGKTNLIEGIEVFAHLVEGTPLHKFSDVGKGGYCQVRGGLGNCVRFGTAEFELRFNIVAEPEIKSSFRGLDYKIKISGTAQHESILSEENFVLNRIPEEGMKDVTLFSAQRSGDALKVEYNSFTGDKSSISMPANHSVMSRYQGIIATGAAKNAQRDTSLLAVDLLISCLKTAYIFDTSPKAMRDYERVTAYTELSRDGSNLSAVLYALKKNEKLEELKRITEIARHLPEEPFWKIGFIETSANDVMLGFYVNDGKTNKRLIDARMLSDGTLRLLAILAALETVPENSRVVLEEFDNGLHPSRVQRLIKHMYETAERRKLSILVTTHNPAVMNALNEAEMGSVVLCHRDPETGHSKLTPLMSVRDIDLMMLRGSLGDLVTDEIVEKYLSPEYRKKRAEIARKWKERYFP